VGHYEVQEIPYGKDYKWVSVRTLTHCDCGHKMNLDIHHTVCPGCNTDHAAVVREVAGRHLADEVLHPWHPGYEAWLRFKESHSECENWLKQMPRK
jgi:hypothetical protein